MARRTGWVALAVLLSISFTASAGDKTHCTKQAGDCAKGMAEKYGSSGWLGIETEKNDKGVVIIKGVTDGSPAEAAGFQKGDVLVAINGVEISDANQEALKAAKKALVAGGDARYTVLRHGAKTTLTAKLVAPPRSVMAQWVGEHMLSDHAGAQVAAAK